MSYKTPEEHRMNLDKEHPYWTEPGSDAGVFTIPTNGGNMLLCIATPGEPAIPWEHVSVSVKRIDRKRGQLRDLDRCPTWEEMSRIKDLFWETDDTVVQFHPPEDEYVSNHKYTLHLWRKQNEDFETPPAEAVGFTTGKDIDE